jgi:hypothetical protein
MCNTVNTGYGLSISQSALPEVSPAGEAGYDLTISQPTLPEVSPAGEAGHAGYGLSISQSTLPEAVLLERLDMILQSAKNPS